MNLKKYDNKIVRIIDTENNCFEGICYYNSKEYTKHEYGIDEESLQILNIIFYKSSINKIEIIENFKSNEYSDLEKLIIDSDIDFIEDALDIDDKIHRDRLILCIKDNINKFKNKEEIEKLIKDR